MDILLFLMAASLAPSSVCQLSATERQVYRKGFSTDLQFPARRQALESSLRSCPNDLPLFSALSSLLVAHCEFNAAEVWTAKGLGIAPEDVTLNLRRGEALVGLGQGKAALAALSKSQVTGESQLFAGLAYQLLQDHRHARDCFLDAWKRGNEDPYVLYCLMREDKDLSDKAAGLEHFKIMLSRFPNSAWVHILLGDVHFQMDREAEARSEYLMALKLMPDLFEPNFRLAYISFEAGEYDSAIRYYRSALAVKSHHTEANVYLGEALRRSGRLSAATEQLQLAINVDPTSPLAYDSLAKALSDGGHLKEASTVLQTAEKEFPDNSSFPAMRAHVLKRIGRTLEAEQESRRASEIIAEKNNKEALIH